MSDREMYRMLLENQFSNAQKDPVNNPKHYTEHPSGIECIQITEHMGFNLGNAVKYIWRCDLKCDAVEDLEKARWYIDREIAKRKKEGEEKKGGDLFGLALNVRHKKCHEAADAFWKYWNENGETHKRGYYESTWGAINRAIRLVGVVPWSYGGTVEPAQQNNGKEA